MSLLDNIRTYSEWHYLREAYDRLRLMGKPPTRLVCHPEHVSQAELAVRSLGLPLRVNGQPKCPLESIFITGDDDGDLPA